MYDVLVAGTVEVDMIVGAVDCSLVFVFPVLADYDIIFYGRDYEFHLLNVKPETEGYRHYDFYSFLQCLIGHNRHVFWLNAILDSDSLAELERDNVAGTPCIE